MKFSASPGELILLHAKRDKVTLQL